MTATQATKQLLDMGCVYLSIVDIEGNTIVPKQQNKLTTTADIKKQADKINTYLKTAPPGIYVIEGRIGGTSKATQMLINIGNVAPSNGNNSQPLAQPMADHAANNVLSYDRALALQKEISDLTAENTRL